MKTAARQTDSVRETKILVGQNIAAARKERGLTQAQLGDMAGIDAITVSRTETGSTTLSLARLVEIADALDVSLATLVSRSNPGAAGLADEMAASLKRLREPDRQFLFNMFKQWSERLAKK